MFRLTCIIIGYFIGCFQTAYILAKATAKIDIREHGSGNAGMTNVVRVIGAKAGIIVFIADVLKAFLGYSICSLIFNGSGTFFTGDGIFGYLPGLYGGLGVILGHNYPFYMKFKGGKGVASLLGIMLFFDAKVALICYFIGFIVLLLTKIVSVSSLVMSALFPILILIFNFPLEVVILGFILMIISYYKHSSNIKRLLKGEENKLEVKR